MRLHNLSPMEGSRAKSVRVGRGTGSGVGKTSGKGQMLRYTNHHLPCKVVELFPAPR